MQLIENLSIIEKKNKRKYDNLIRQLLNNKNILVLCNLICSFVHTIIIHSKKLL